jgi:hypothetical protein
MNLAQLIDPERVQNGAFAWDPLARRPAPLPPMGVVTRDPDEKVTQSQLRGLAEETPAKTSAAALVLDIVSRNPDGLTFEAIAREVGDRYEQSRVQLALQGLVQQKRLRREGRRGASRWFAGQAVP